ncbi:uncharacterized protein CLUP02_17443 [Colletotrichum lupini]|uniref:Uncharacterized protein n=1 Tax=Colletotrichum lupini TaxID=145971 RepID=A0A9Q8SEJ5_9PEZI|nr:uncharacterized protein CLUP02_17443 [Colletotrichum lupini]UQC75934.1 hypothetical protein CLUP02_17443 [Colletotrichum lupini]
MDCHAAAPPNMDQLKTIKHAQAPLCPLLSLGSLAKRWVTRWTFDRTPRTRTIVSMPVSLRGGPRGLGTKVNPRIKLDPPPSMVKQQRAIGWTFLAFPLCGSPGSDFVRAEEVLGPYAARGSSSCGKGIRNPPREPAPLKGRDKPAATQRTLSLTPSPFLFASFDFAPIPPTSLTYIPYFLHTLFLSASTTSGQYFIFKVSDIHLYNHPLVAASRFHVPPTAPPSQWMEIPPNPPMPASPNTARRSAVLLFLRSLHYGYTYLHYPASALLRITLLA